MGRPQHATDDTPTDDIPIDDTQAGSAPGAGPASATDRVADLRVELEQVDTLPVDERVALFDRANTTLAAELAALDDL